MKSPFSKLFRSKLFRSNVSRTASERYSANPEHTPTLELRIPISANDKYMRMLQYLLESLQLFGGPIAKSAHSVVSVSADEPRFDIEERYPWVKNYSVEFHWLEQELFDAHTYDATGYHRFWVKPLKADVIALVDADILISGDFDSVVNQCYLEQKALGFIAHVSPFDNPEYTHISSEKWWEKLFSKAGLPSPRMEYEHTGWGFMSDQEDHRYCPAYFNYGFILVPRQDIIRMGESFVEDLAIVDSVAETWFKSQIANNIAFIRHGIPTGTLPLNYNFPLHVPSDKIRSANPDPQGEDNVGDIRVFHYLGEGEVNKEHFSSDQSLQEVLERKDMSDAGTFFQNRLRIVHNSLVPRSRTIYLHIGRGKTGTTTIQKFLATNHNRLIDSGIHYLHSDDLGQGHGHQNFAKSFIDHLPDYMVPAVDPNKVRMQIFEEIRQSQSNSIIISSENFPLANIEKVRDYFLDLPGSFTIKIVLFARSQDELAESEYNQFVKLKSETRTLYQYARESLKGCNFLEVADDWAKHFGKENIICRVADMAKKQVVQDFLSCINATIIEGTVNTPKSSANLAPNTSVGIRAMVIARLLNELDIPDRQTLYDNIFPFLSGNDTPALLFSSQEAREFRAQFAQSNKEFSQHYLGVCSEDLGGRRYSDEERDRIRAEINALHLTAP